MAQRRIARDECLTLLQAGWILVQDRGQVTARHGRRSTPVASSTLTVLLREGLVERDGAQTGKGNPVSTYRLRSNLPPGEFKLA